MPNNIAPSPRFLGRRAKHSVTSRHRYLAQRLWRVPGALTPRRALPASVRLHHQSKRGSLRRWSARRYRRGDEAAVARASSEWCASPTRGTRWFCRGQRGSRKNSARSRQDRASRAPNAFQLNEDVVIRGPGWAIHDAIERTYELSLETSSNCSRVARYLDTTSRWARQRASATACHAARSSATEGLSTLAARLPARALEYLLIT